MATPNEIAISVINSNFDDLSSDLKFEAVTEADIVALIEQGVRLALKA
jgi:sulfur transfer complex TusBCD TusB component (DsrH family)